MESDNLPTKLAFPYHLRSSLINNLIFNLFTTVGVCVCVCLFPSTVEASPDRNKTNVMPEIRPAMLC